MLPIVGRSGAAPLLAFEVMNSLLECDSPVIQFRAASFLISDFARADKDLAIPLEIGELERKVAEIGDALGIVQPTSEQG